MQENDPSTADIRRSSRRFRLKKTVALVGMMGAGKTAVGRSVAAKLGVPFLDSDAEIEAAANLSVPEIFQRDGEAFFRKREAEVIRRLLEARRGILSTGGGAYLAQCATKTRAPCCAPPIRAPRWRAFSMIARRSTSWRNCAWSVRPICRLTRWQSG